MYNNQQVNDTNTYTYIGHQLDSSLTLTNDFDTVYKKRTSTRLKLLSKVRCYLNEEAAMKIYLSTILPILTYSLAIKLYLDKNTFEEADITTTASLKNYCQKCKVN